MVLWLYQTVVGEVDANADAEVALTCRKNTVNAPAVPRRTAAATLGLRHALEKTVNV